MRTIATLFRNLLLTLLAVTGASAATFTVTNTNDTGAGSLRQAVLDSNAAAGSDTIVFDSSFSTQKTITLASPITINPATGDSLTITGPGRDLLTVSGNSAVQIFFVSAGDTASVGGMTLANGKNNNGGAGIDNRGNLTVANAAFISNMTNNEGGAISTQGALTVSNTTFKSNSAGNGGAIAIDANGSATISNSTFADHATGYGGAIANDGVLNVSDCTFTNNQATSGSATGLGGGAIYCNSGTKVSSVTSSTFTGNAEVGGSGGGGGISNRSGTLTIKTSTFTSNTALDGGGAVSNRGSLTISGSKFTKNSASGPNAEQSGQGSGGAISSQGSGDLTISDAFISENAAVNHGGGIYFQPNATAGPPMVITNTTISDNVANSDHSGAGDGGGIASYGSGPVTITRSTISGNSTFSSGSSSGRGGGIYSLRKLTMDLCTVSGNSAGSQGGGVFDDYPGGANSEVVITNSTIVFNQATNGGGIRSSNSVGDVPTSVGNTIVAHNTGSPEPDVVNPFSSAGFNLIGGDAKLVALADNGGPTKTHALAPGSPAIDQGKRLSEKTTDQRGVARPTDDPAIANAPGGDGSDIGAFEIGASNGVAEKTLGNIATRLPVLTGERVLIGGIIVVGNVPKKVIIRAIGPSLGAAGVPGTLDDPTLELFQGSTLLASNDNWRESQEQEISGTGVAPSDNREAAIVRTLDPGNYTAIVRGKNDTTGVALVDGYDLDQRPDSKLANISTRGFVGSGDNVLIGGFIAGPSTRVVVRGLGPSLANAGIQGALQDPTLQLVDSNGGVVRSNDNWKATQRTELEAIGIQPSDDRESALIATLTAGNYTAVVAGTGANTGVGLVEVYNLQ